MHLKLKEEEKEKKKIEDHLLIEEFKRVNFDENEVSGVVLVDAKSTLDLFSKWEWKIQATIISDNWKENREVDASEFLVTKDETLLWKYGDVLKKIISLT